MKDREGTAVLEKLDMKTPEKTPRQQFYFSSSMLLNDLKRKAQWEVEIPNRVPIELRIARPGDLSEFAEAGCLPSTS